ncbi:hypothetical protein GCM10023322_55270 [Rugosimonospora acidiphila]|uniref:Carbohydrate binding domain-containing protein n=1 Tax=Rugosimonospora acidiphila TaxID=556531 RepID=A0ABP9SA88_9ACTN
MGTDDQVAACRDTEHRQLSRRGFLAASLTGLSIAVLAPVGAPAWAGTATRDGAVTGTGNGAGTSVTMTVRPASLAGVYVGGGARQFTVEVNADTLRWTVRDLWGAIVRAGTQPVRGGKATLRLPVDAAGYYTLDVTAVRGATPVAESRSSFAVLTAYRLPADSPFGANTHLQPAAMVPLMATLGITWARTDLTWTEIEPPPLAGWTTDVYQADASVTLDKTVAHSGHASVKIVNRSAKQDNYYATISQDITVQPNTTYTFSAWVKGQDVRALQFTLQPDWGSRTDAPSGTYGWTRVRFQYTTTTETTLTFRLLSSDATAAAWMDDASVTAAGSDTNLLTNPGFEKGLVTGYTFDTFTPYLSALADHGIHPLPILDYANPKYDGGLTPYDDAGRTAFAAYTTAVMRHYRHQFTAVEVYNEYNAGWFTTGPASADPTAYAALLASTYDAVKSVDPAVTVVGGVTYGTALDWLTAMFEAGGIHHLDAVSNHPYTGAPEDDTPLDEAERQVTQLIQQYNGGAAKPVWVSELGWSLGDPLTTAGYLVRGLVLALAGGVQKFFWYDLVGDQNFGLLNQDGPDYTPRPAFVAYAAAIRLLTGRTLASTGDLQSAGIRSYVFAGPHPADDDLAVLWSTNAREAVAVATTSPLTLLDVAGTSHTLTPYDGHVYLTLTGTPVYLRAPRLADRPGLVTASTTVDVSAPQLAHTSDQSVTLTYVLDNSASSRPAELTFTTLGVATPVRAPRGQRVQVPATIPVGDLDLGKNTLITQVTDGQRVVGRLVCSVVVIEVPDVAVATVGTVDWSSRELALAPDGYGDYPTRFPDDVSFTVGVDDPAQSWPYIHPGPDDGWAGGRTHTFTLNFTLPTAPAHDLQLVVFLLDTHNTAPGAVAVTLGGGSPTTVTLPAGSGSGYAAPDALTSGDQPTQFTVPLPASGLSAGKNTVTLTKTIGSWMVYDAVGIYQS